MSDPTIKALHDTAKRVAELRERAAAFSHAANLLEQDTTCPARLRTGLIRIAVRLRNDAFAALETAAQLEHQMRRVEDPRVEAARRRAMESVFEQAGDGTTS